MRKRVLVVEGDARRRGAIRDALVACGLEVVESPSVTEAIGRFKATSFDGLVVADEQRQLALKGLCTLARKDSADAPVFVLLRPGSDRFRVTQAAGGDAILIPEGGTLEEIAARVIAKFGAGAPEIWRYTKTRTVHRSRLWESHLAKSPDDSGDVLVAHLSEQFAKDPDLRAEFLGPTEAARSVEHENLPGVRDIGGNHDIPFVVYSISPGMTLAELLKRHGRGEARLSPQLAAHLASQIAAPLAVAHDASLVHGAIAPQSVWIAADGRIKLYYLGFAGFLGVLERSMGSQLGMSVPDPYVSPEQLKNGPIDHRTDVFLLGVILHELLSGRAPFLRGHHQETANAVLSGPIVRPTGPAMPGDLVDLTMACLERNPSFRPASLREVMEGLAKIAQASGPSPAATKRSASMSGGREPASGFGGELARLVGG